MTQMVGVTIVVVIALLFVAFAVWQAAIARRATDGTTVTVNPATAHERQSWRYRTRLARDGYGVTEAGLWPVSR